MKKNEHNNSIENGYNIDKSHLTLWALIGNTIIFGLTTTTNIKEVFPFGFVASITCAIFFNGYAYLFLKFTKKEIILISGTGIMCGFATPLIISIIMFPLILY